MKRIFSIDFTRGVVMMIMALDHVRDLIHESSITQSPTDLRVTTPAIFFTRWITYLCAPIFVFLAGTSAYLAFKKRSNFKEQRSFLFKRGLFLLVLEFTVVNTGMFLDLGFHLLLFEVIATIGTGFILLALLLKLSPKTIGIIGLLIIFFHDTTAFIPLQQGSLAMTLLTPLFSPAAFPFWGNHVFVMGYPPIPWLGIMLVGYATGILFERPIEERKRIFLLLGIVSVLLFAVLRWINVYGDPVPWTQANTQLYTFLSFMNVSKYPPSLSFTLVTSGCMFLILWIGERVKGMLATIPSVYGKAPLFYFVVHFYFIHFILLVVLFIQGFHWTQLDFADGSFGRPKAVHSGLPLWSIYLIWIGVVLVMYAPCRWFARYRSNHSNSWLKYV